MANTVTICYPCCSSCIPFWVSSPLPLPLSFCPLIFVSHQHFPYFKPFFTHFTAMISYNVVVGDTLSKVLVRFFPSWGDSMGAVRLGVVFFVTVGVVVPLCLYKNVSRLARASFISLACVVFILFAVIIKLMSGDYKV